METLIWIYRDWVLQGVIPQFTAFEWKRRFSAAGEFTLQLPFTQEYFQLLKIGSVVLHKLHNEAAFIEEVNVVTSSEGKRSLRVWGRSIASLLDRRVVSYTGSGQFAGIINGILTNNFITPTNARRKIPNLRISPYTVRASTVNAKIEQQVFLDSLSRMLKSRDIGLRMLYNIEEKSYDFSLYEGVESGAIFSSEYKNLLEQDYYRSTQHYKNTVYIDDYVHGDENVGLDRREVATLRTEDSSMTAETTATLFLLDFRATETFDAVLNPQSKQFEYIIDWNLGDIVSCRNSDFEIDITKNISEISEYYDLNGLHITVVFGDYFRTLSEQIRSEIIG